MAYEPKFDLATYRQFIRDASPFVSLVLGRKIKPAEGDVLSDIEMLSIAEKIDKRVDDLNASVKTNLANGMVDPQTGAPQVPLKSRGVSKEETDS